MHTQFLSLQKYNLEISVQFGWYIWTENESELAVTGDDTMWFVSITQIDDSDVCLILFVYWFCIGISTSTETDKRQTANMHSTRMTALLLNSFWARARIYANPSFAPPNFDKSLMAFLKTTFLQACAAERLFNKKSNIFDMHFCWWNRNNLIN